MPRPSEALSAILPPLILGTATFNSQYNLDPYALPTTGIVHRALSLGVRAFDTSPYYGPAEELLGQALDTDFVHDRFPRSDYFLLTKVGRIGGSEFDYSAGWVRKSIKRSLERLKTEYLDVVYCHDCEFVSSEEVLIAVTELRKIRNETGTIKYVGISGYPVTVLGDLAEMILEKTGEPLDIVMSYGNFTVQNTRLSSVALPRLKAARVDVVANASVLGMGLLRSSGVPVGAQGDWHPSPDELRAAIAAASRYCDSHNDKIEEVSIRFALEEWIHEGGSVGSRGDPAYNDPWKRKEIGKVADNKLGVSVMGVSNLEELEETIGVWHSVLDGITDNRHDNGASDRRGEQKLRSLQRQREVKERTAGIREKLGSWVDYAWASPGPGFVNKRAHSPQPA